MSDAGRPESRWSNSMSAATKATAYSNQTIPLTSVRRKLFRHSLNNQRTYAQRLAKSKRDIEELFKLYYSNDIKFDTIHRQIVMGTRIPSARTAPTSSTDLTSNSSTNMFSSKHCVSREQMNNTDVDGNETIITTASAKSAPVRRSRPMRTENPAQFDSPTPIYNPPITVTPVIQNPASPKKQQEELCESSIVKSVTFLEDLSNEIANTEPTKINNSPRSKSSLLTSSQTPAPPSSLLSVNTNSTSRKDPLILSRTSFSTGTTVQAQPQKAPPAIITGSAVVVRPRSPGKLLRNRTRPKSTAASVTTTTTSSFTQLIKQARSPSAMSPLSLNVDAPEYPVYNGPQRIVSIPSRCSRYVLVTFPEVPLRYNAPSYVERLLLPERFPTLFQNIVQSYEPHRHEK